jgi:PAS domain S-box-containing protein
MRSTHATPETGHPEEVLLEAQSQWLRYQELFDFASDGYVMTDLQGIIQEANYAAASLLNARKEFLTGKPLGLYVAEPSRHAFYSILARQARSGAQACEVTVSMARGEPRHMRLSMTPLGGEDGKPVSLRWALRDISLARRIEQALHTEKTLADCLLDLAEIVILVVDPAGRILRCNAFLLAITGQTAENLRGRKWCEVLLPAEYRDEGLLLMQRVAEDVSARTGVLGLTTRSGPRRFVTWSARQLDDTVVLVGHDVTQLQEAQRNALLAARLAAIGQMATGLAHESRNALQRSQACLSILMLRLKNDPEILELLSRVQKAQDDLQHLFEDVRSYAAYLPLQRQLCNLSQIWREAWENLRAASGQPPADLSEDIEGVDLFCFADPFYLRQVFRNLLENALISGADPVRIVLRCRPAWLGKRDAIQVSVRDNGPGFPPAQRQRLFEPFFTTKLKGTGLGLAICRRIVETHGGRIEAGQDRGAGAEILITLPRRET